MAEQSRITGSSLTSFDEAANSAFSMVLGDPRRGHLRAAEVERMWMSGGGFVGLTHYHVDLRVLDSSALEEVPSVEGVAGLDPVETSWSCEGWSATHDFMPGSQPTLMVSGTCTAPTGGHSFTLVRHEPQGFNPHDLLLRLDVVQPDGPAPDAISQHEVRYTEETGSHYDTVSILPHGPFGLEVQIVQ